MTASHFKRFLIVEENAQMRRTLRSFVADLADEVSECEDGSQALMLYAQLLPEWVLMDIQMQGMDGLTATREIIALYPNAKVMIISDYDDGDLRRAACDAGACRFINKGNLLDVRQALQADTNH